MFLQEGFCQGQNVDRYVLFCPALLLEQLNKYKYRILTSNHKVIENWFLVYSDFRILAYNTQQNIYKNNLTSFKGRGQYQIDNSIEIAEKIKIGYFSCVNFR